MGQSVLITGGNGFIGRHLIALLQKKSYQLVLAEQNRGNVQVQLSNLISRKFDLSQEEDQYQGLFDDIDVVIHLAGIAHKKSVAWMDYQQVNVEGTLKLARQAQRHGVRRFIFLSTVKVHGESSSNKHLAFTEQSHFNPRDNYSQSKLEAEKAVKQICAQGQMEYVIVRVPLVYGPGVKANFFKLLKMLSHHYPLPFSRVVNQRSLLYVENLCDLLEKTITSPNCKNREYLVKDSNLSTTELVTRLSNAFGFAPRLFYISPGLVQTCARLLKQSAIIDRLFGSLLIDDARIRQELSWQPPVDTDMAIKRTVEWYRNIHA